MSYNSYRDKVSDQLIRDMGDLKAFVRSIRGNQTRTLKYGGITLDGENDVITIEGENSKFITFVDNAELNVGNIKQKRYVPGGVTVTDMIYSTNHSDSDDRDTYETHNINTQDDSARDTFFQMACSYRSGTFNGAYLNFTKEVNGPSFQVAIDNVDGSGYITIPYRSTDPTASTRRMYYNSTSNKFRICEGSTWKDMTTEPTGITGILGVTTPYGLMNMEFENGLLVAYDFP